MCGKRLCLTWNQLQAACWDSHILPPTPTPWDPFPSPAPRQERERPCLGQSHKPTGGPCWLGALKAGRVAGLLPFSTDSGRALVTCQATRQAISGGAGPTIQRSHSKIQGIKARLPREEDPVSGQCLLSLFPEGSGA